MKGLLQKWRNWARRWRKREDGAAAVEFALVSAAFMWVFLGIVELGLLMIFSGGLEDGVDKVARLIRTGQADKGGLTAAQMRETICKQVVLKTACKTALVLDVRSFPDFGSISLPSPGRDSNGNPKLPASYQIGGPKKVVVVRAFYPWKFITPLIGRLMHAFNDQVFIVEAATAFRNEPYGS